MEWFVADFTANGKVDVVTVSKSSVSVEAVVDDSRSSATSTTSTYSSSAVVEVALGTFAILDGKERNVILHFLNSNAELLFFVHIKVAQLHSQFTKSLSINEFYVVEQMNSVKIDERENI